MLHFIVSRRINFSIDLHVDFMFEDLALFVYPLYATTPTAAKIPMMATTTRSSIRVKPLFL